MGKKYNISSFNATVVVIVASTPRIYFNWGTFVITFSCRQDVAFFDANKTGQLVNRLTADIQEFKSSFKQVISQVRGEISALDSIDSLYPA